MSQPKPSLEASVDLDGVVHEVYFSPSYRRLLLVVWVGAAVVCPSMVGAGVLGGPGPGPFWYFCFWFFAILNGFLAITVKCNRDVAVVRVLEDGSLQVRVSIIEPWRRRLPPGWRVVERGPKIVFLQGARTKAAWPANALGWKEEEVPKLLSLNPVP